MLVLYFFFVVALSRPIRHKVWRGSLWRVVDKWAAGGRAWWGGGMEEAGTRERRKIGERGF